MGRVQTSNRVKTAVITLIMTNMPMKENIIAVKNPPPCSGEIQFSHNVFMCHISAWGPKKPDLTKLGWKLFISWYPTYSFETKSINVVRDTIAAGLNRLDKAAFIKYTGRKPKKIIDESKET